MNQKLFFMFSLLVFSALNSFGQSDSLRVKVLKSDKVILKPQNKPIDPTIDSIYKWRILQSHLDDVYIPYDINDCCKQLDKLMEAAVKKRFMAFSDEEVDRKTHASLGKWIDHKWQITEGSRISNYFRKAGVPHPEYSIGIIITSYHRYLHKKDLKLKEQIDFFKKKWNEEQKEKALDLLKKN
jgi:hypothetical protein